MSTSSGSELSAFKSAYQLLIRTARRSVNTINQDPKNLAQFCQFLSAAFENENRQIYIVGVGRSGKIGKILGECLKDIGLANRISYLGKDLVLSVSRDDVIIAITGSGWTILTTSILEDCIRNKCKILTFTGVSDSKAAKLSDVIIQNPLGYQPQDHTYPFTSRRAPLSPLGSVFELTTLVIGMGVINGVYSGSCTNGFNDGTTEILKAAEDLFTEIQDDSNLSTFIQSLKKYYHQQKTKIFFYGSGLDNIICEMSALRFQSLGLNVHPINDWRFRHKGDLLVAISGSGNSSKTLNIVKSAKTSQMKIFGITSFPQSKLAERSDNLIVVLGRKEKVDPDTLQLLQPELYLPTFEYTTAVTLEACLAQIAVDLDISENSI